MSRNTPASRPNDHNTAAAERALQTFLDLVRIDSPSGQEAAVADWLLDALRRTGVIVERDAAGNVIGRRPGRGAGASLPPLLLSAHMDTVQGTTSVVPVVRDGVVRSEGDTILGADDKAGITAIQEALRRTASEQVDCRTVEVAFTVREETGLTGAKALDLAAFAARQALVLDSDGPLGKIVNRAPAQNSIEATIIGRAAHAGVSPERGISAIQAAARALGPMRLGRVDDETTANVGIISGGTARNIVPERVRLVGEARSRDERKLEAQTRHMVELLETAAAELGARAEIQVARSYAAINVREDSPLVHLVRHALERHGVAARLEPTGGGSDANIFAANGLEALNIGVGIEDPHSVDEHIAVADLLASCDVLVTILTAV